MRVFRTEVRAPSTVSKKEDLHLVRVFYILSKVIFRCNAFFLAVHHLIQLFQSFQAYRTYLEANIHFNFSLTCKNKICQS